VTKVARRLTLACRSGVEVEVEGAAWAWPARLDGLQAGDQVLVYAELPAARPLRVRLDGDDATPEGAIATAERPLLARAAAQARIERLLHLRETALAGDEDVRRALLLEVVELSVEHRVLSPYTALLVLETEADYARFGLDRRALADILTVGPGGLDVVARSAPRLPTVTTTGGKVVDEAVSPPSWDDALFDVAREPAVGAERGETRAAAQIPQPDPAPAGDALAYAAGGEPAAPLRVSAPEEGFEEEIEVEPRRRIDRVARRREALRPAPATDPYDGRFAEVMEHLAAGRRPQARALAETWVSEVPGDVLALLALGEAWEAIGDTGGAARAYGSLIDLFPGRADLRRLAGERLERLGDAGLPLAVDTYRKAVEQRPDHPSGHRLLAWALLRSGDPAAAFAALEAGLDGRYPTGRFAGVDRVLGEDLGLVAAAWLRAEPERGAEVRERLRLRGVPLATRPSLRFVLTWETDANDVDLHVYDAAGGHASYRQPALPSGGELFADVTTGYGPECFAVPGEPSSGALPYRLQAHYYSRGPMGYGMGTLQVIAHDGAGSLRIEPRPFVVMTEGATVDLGSVGPVRGK